jgi:dienelactone hydrolase
MAALAALPSARAFAQATPAVVPVIGGQLYSPKPRVQADESFDLGVIGLAPGAAVTIRSALVDIRNRTFTAEATWVADDFGLVDCARTAPVSGTFDVADAMAFVWAAVGTAPHTPSLVGTESITFTATVDDFDLAPLTIEREILPEEHGIIPVAEDGFIGEYYPPLTDGPAPGVIVVGGSDGGLAQYTQVIAALLASHGYAALAVAYFGIGDLPPTLSRIPLEYFAAPISWLQSRPEVHADRLGVVGVSRGGELSLLIGAHYPEITAVVSYVGGGYVYGEYDPGNPNLIARHSAWTWEGEEPPHFTGADLASSVAAEIPVERIEGPVLLLSGEGDLVWPSNYLSDVAYHRLMSQGHAWPFQHLAFPGAGHNIGPPYFPSLLLYGQFQDRAGGDPRSDISAAVSGWAAVLAMFDWRLRLG